MATNTVYPKLRKKLGLIGGICLLIWGAFILGMQLYVFCYYTNVYGEKTDDPNQTWGDAYSGMALANASACLLIGLYYVIMFTEKTTASMLLWGMILAVFGGVGAIASTVLSAIEADWLNVAVNEDSTHPCRYESLSETNPTFPTPLECTNWLALEVTVSVLSGLAVSEYIFLGCIIFLGLSGGKQGLNNAHHYGHGTSLRKTEHPPIVRLNNNNPMNRTTSAAYDGPYNAYSQQPATAPQQKSLIDPYEGHNPQYSYHLQQLELQQQQQQQQMAGQHTSFKSPMTNSSAPSVHRESVASSQVGQQRGQLQILHNQRQRAPAPPVPVKPQSSSLYRY